MNIATQAIATDVFNTSEARRQTIEQINNNSGKAARVGYTHETKGTGAVLLQEPVTFGCQFIEEPGVTTGLVLPKGQRLKSVKIKPTTGATSQININTAKAAGTLTAEQRDADLPAKDAKPDSHGTIPADDIDFPYVQAGVYDFQVDPDSGMYIGAYLFIVVQGGNYRLHHHFVFDGIAIKQLNDQVLEGL